MHIIITYKDKSVVLPFVAQMIHTTLQEMGVSSEISPTNSLDTFSSINKTLILVVGHGLPPFTKNPQNKYLAWDIEQTPYKEVTSPLMQQKWEYVSTIIPLYDYYYTNYSYQADFIQKCGYPCGYASIGYHELMSLNVEEATKKYDILFYGAMSERRKEIIKKLENLDLKVHYQHIWDNTEKIKIMKQSKICLNVHYSDAPFFEKIRIYEWMANKGFVISETLSSPEILEDKIHYISAPYNNLVDAILQWLSPEKEKDRQIIMQAGYEQIKKDHISISIKKILQEINFKEGLI